MSSLPLALNPRPGFKVFPLLLGFGLTGSFLLNAISPAWAKSPGRNYAKNTVARSAYSVSQSPTYTNATVPAGTLIPLTDSSGQNLTVIKGQSRSLTLQTASTIRNSAGRIVIPQGSDVVGQLRPTAEGVQFIAQQIILPSGQWAALNAISPEIVGFTTKNQGATAADIIKGTLAGAGTATILAGTTGDRHINALEVLGGAAFGALAGWGLPAAGILGGQTQEVLTLNPQQDLTLTLQAPLTLNGNQEVYRGYGVGRAQP
jgi:hypothetical protein